MDCGGKKRHAAFVRANALIGSLKRRAGESGVAAALCHRTPKCCFAARCCCPFCGYSFFENALTGAFPQESKILEFNAPPILARPPLIFLNIFLRECLNFQNV
jgi:hypothetical protein